MNIKAVLDPATFDHIKSLVRQKHVEYNKLNDVIGAQIFNILESNSRVLYYPLEDEDVWGFSEKIKGQSFVCINTSIHYDKQVFAAAHELYHLWFDDEDELILSSALEEVPSENGITIDELKANRFAAEFLVEENLLRQEMTTYSISKDKVDIRDLLKLSHLFSVPYKTMVKRLYEVGIISKSGFNKFIAIPEIEVEIWRKRLGITLPTRENKIGLDNLVDNAMELYERNLITLEKLEYLLSFSQLTLQQLGIEQPQEYIPPTDDELQSMKDNILNL